MTRARALLLAILAAAAPAGLLAADSHPSIGNFGFDLAGMDSAVKPGNDFNLYANGKWIKSAVIPGDRAYWGVWDVLDEKSRADTRAILEEAAAAHAAAGTNQQKIGDYYASFMDEAAIEAKGTAPLKPQLDAIAAIQDYHQLAAAMGHALYAGDAMPVGLEVMSDFKRPDIAIGYLAQDGLGLPDRDYYLQDDPKMAEARNAYKAYVAKLLLLAGLAANDGDAAARANAVFDAEHRLAEIQWSRVQLRDIPAQYNPWGIADYAAKAPGFDWAAFFKGAGLDGQPMLVATTISAITGTAKIIPNVPLPVWRDYMAIRAIDRHAPFLSKAFVDAHFAFHSTALAGTPEQEARWKRGSTYARQAMGEAIGEIYVQRHFSPEAKAQAKLLVANLLAAMGRHIDGLDWMSPETKAKAHAKLATFNPKIAYPDKWRDYGKLKITPGDAYGNAIAADVFEYQRNLAKLGKPVDRTEWGMTPMTINAYYDPTMNEIVFPAAVLQPPFFDPNADAAVNYGGIGAIIGHEISHGFDDQGRLFDPKGALADWWTEEDAKRFKTRTDALVAQYSAYEALPGLHINGELTLGENIADTAGLAIAYDAYHAALGGTPAPVIDGLSGDQRFFLGFAQNWRTIWRDAMLRQAVTTDPHSPDAIRTRTVRNFDPWYAAFGVKPGEGMYLAPKDRVHIW
jgi:putative endopeptidase